ncbi:MAG: DNA polymerase III subunit alpha [Candidatus Desulfofervidus auxilii]|nr:DNA polymerase III subunit alpha [Candidatus Desulfofervidus auxilii]
MAEFVHLHVHTQYSLLDGAIRLTDLMAKAKEYHMPAVAMTDHGNLFGAIEFYEMALESGLKPIIGCEVYIAPDYKKKAGKEKLTHLLLLAENEIGYRNLLKLISISYLEGFYYKPRIDKALLSQYHEGLIAMSACLHGEIPSLLLQGNYEAAKKAAQSYVEIFGKENFYLELQANGLPEQEIVNKGLIRLSHELEIPLVATNDCHYLNKEDAYAHDILLCIQTGKSVNEKNRLRFSNDQFYFKSPEEMVNIFAEVPEAIKNTLVIAERCNLRFELDIPHFPVFPVPKGETLESYLWKKAEEGLEKKLEKRGIKEEDKKTYRERLKYELDVITQMGFAGYFLIVADIINYAKKRGIPVGPGRGSAAGSLVAYALNITEIDPLPYGLLFERFLNPERKSLPDIDTDICMERREEVLKYIFKKYGGKEHVAQIITFGKMQARAVVRDVGRALDMSYQEVDKIAKLIPPALNISLADAIAAEPRLQKLAEQDERVKKLLTIAQALEGLPRHASTHAAGIVISDEKPLVHYLPLYRGNKGEVVTQFDMKGVERIGLIKFDFLGLKTLTVIDKTLSLIEKHKGIRPDISQIPLDDKATYQLLSRGDTTGVFQLESSGMKELLKRLKPNCFEDLIALIALYRPGPLESGMVDEFINRKHGKIPIKYELPELEPILKQTYGVILYQEQVMEIAVALAGYTLGQADNLRKAMGKKMPELMAQERIRFIEGAVKKGIPRKKAEHIFNLMEKFAGYGFNKSHSTAYALIAYRTAYLKTHYPTEFMAALLTCEMNSMDEVVKYVNECRDKGIEILPPDINRSEMDFVVEDGKIRFGLAAIKNVGTAAVPEILKARKKGLFKSLMDFCQRVDLQKVNKRVIESLIKAGAFDSLGVKRSQLMFVLSETIDKAQRKLRRTNLNQLSLFDTVKETSEIELPPMEEWSDDIRLTYEKEALGFYLTGHPLKGYEEVLKNLSNTNTEKISELPDKTPVKLGGIITEIKEISSRKGERMAFATLEDTRGKVEVVIFSSVYQEAENYLNSDQPIFITGHVSKDENSSKIIAEKICFLEEEKEKLIKKEHFSKEQQKEIKIILREGNIEKKQLLYLKQILQQYKGNLPVYFKILPSNILVALPPHLKVTLTEDFIKKINQLLGYEAVIIE